MFRTIKDFITDWEIESALTLKIFRAVTDASLEQKIYPEGRTLGRLAWHITGSLGEMPRQAGLKAVLPTADDPVPNSVAEIAEVYGNSARAIAQSVKTQWNDVMLGETVPMFGKEWERGKVLTALITHQVHHRAQMTVLMRQAGLKVPGIYGPAREEWAAFGREAEK